MNGKPCTAITDVDKMFGHAKNVRYLSSYAIFLILVPVVQRVACTIHRINHYQLNYSIGFGTNIDLSDL